MFTSLQISIMTDQGRLCPPDAKAEMGLVSETHTHTLRMAQSPPPINFGVSSEADQYVGMSGTIVNKCVVVNNGGVTGSSSSIVQSII